MAEHISSRQNALVKQLRALRREGGGAGDVLLDGAHLVQEALDSRIELRLVALASDAIDGPPGELARAAAARGTRVVTLAPDVLDAVSPVRRPSGIVGVAHIARRTLEEVLGAGRRPLVVVLDAVQDPGNVGATIRAAEGCGGTAVVTTPGTADPFGPKALRGAMGSTFRLPVAAAGSMQGAVRAAQAAGLRVFAAVPRGGTTLSGADLTMPAAVLMGGEGPGIPEEIIAMADECLTIPMRAPVESLNVAIAAAVVLYEAARQRNHVTVR